MKKVYVIHGWDGSPEEGWFPWLKEELRKLKIETIIPEMPEPDYPKISPWVNKLKEIITNPDEDTYLVGHSVGCQTILRYLEQLPEGTKVRKVILVAPWTKLNAETLADEDTMEVARPWMESEINWENVNPKAIEFVAVFSKTDPYVSVSQSELFQKELDAEIIFLDGPGHLGGEDSLEELPEVLENLG